MEVVVTDTFHCTCIQFQWGEFLTPNHMYVIAHRRELDPNPRLHSARNVCTKDIIYPRLGVNFDCIFFAYELGDRAKFTT